MARDDISSYFYQILYFPQLFDSIFTAWSVRNYMLSDASSSKNAVKELWKI